MTRTPTPEELNQVAHRLNVTALIRNPSENPADYLTKVKAQLPLDLPTYQQEALLEFAHTHGAYPPALILAEQPHLLPAWQDTLQNHRDQHGARTITKQIAEHHHRITQAINDDVPVLDLAAELNCSTKNLRDYIRRIEVGN